MYGICRIVRLGRPLDWEKGTVDVQGMANAIPHRGFNGSGIHDGEGAGLGGMRLAIRGLNSGRQPIRDPAIGIAVVCNGDVPEKTDPKAGMVPYPMADDPESAFKQVESTIWWSEPSSNNRVFHVALHAGQGMASRSLWRRSLIQNRGR